jgi:hypothetical protein
MTYDVTRRFQRRLSDVRWLSIVVGLTLVLLGLVADRLHDRIPFVTDIRPTPAVTAFASFMVFVGIIVGILGLLRRGIAAVSLAATALPVFLVVGAADLWELDEGVSARPAIRLAEARWPLTDLNSTTSYKLPRSLRFGLNFYLHMELAEWSPPVVRSSIIFTTHKGSGELEQMGNHCLQYIAFPAVEICMDSSKVAGLADGAGDGREAHKKE